MNWSASRLKQYSLSAFTAADQFKSYEELQARLNEVLGINKKSAVRSC